MAIEFEAKFLNVSKSEVRARLASRNATIVRPEFLQKRVNFDLFGEKKSVHAWIRVRDEYDKITLAVKRIEGDRIQDQTEISVTVDDFEKTVAIFEAIGCPRRGLQESRRELWNFRGVEVMIDEWPGLEPYVEIEGPTERAVLDASEALGFDYSQAVFGSAGKVYLLRYGMSAEEVAEKYGAIAFSNEKLKELQRNTPLK